MLWWVSVRIEKKPHLLHGKDNLFLWIASPVFTGMTEDNQTSSPCLWNLTVRAVSDGTVLRR